MATTRVSFERSAPWRAGLILALAVLFLCHACGREPILIGFSGPLTGEYSDLGVQGRNGATLAVEEINAQGGIAGRKLRLLARDDRNSAEEARKADRDLVARGVAAIIGHMTSTQSLAALPVAQKAGVPLISPTTSTPLLSGKEDMFFRVHASSDRIARSLVLFARRNLGLTRVNTLLDQDNRAYTRPFTQDFIRGFEQKQGTVPRKCAFASSEPTDWSEIVDCLMQEDPQGLMLAASARDVAALCGTLASRSLKRPILCSGWAATRSLILQGGKAVEGLYLARSGHPEPKSPEYKDFQLRYRERFGRKPSFPATQGYMAAKVLARALEKTGGKREGLPRALTDIEKLPTLYGPLGLDRYGDVDLPVSILQVKNATFIPVSRIKAGDT